MVFRCVYCGEEIKETKGEPEICDKAPDEYNPYHIISAESYIDTVLDFRENLKRDKEKEFRVNNSFRVI